MRDDEARQVAAALDATPELLPYLADLLADLWDLGSSPDLVVAWVRELDLDRDSTSVLDLGCGKGASSLSLARELGFRVHGVDLFEPFLREARARAAEWGIGHRCRFQRADLRTVVRRDVQYDLLIYASVGGVLGRLDECVAALRRCVRPGGYLLIDHGYLADGGVRSPRGELRGDREQSLIWLQQHGDALLRERVWTPEESHDLDCRYLECIRRRAEELAARAPDHSELILGYVGRQESAAAEWERTGVGATWLLQKR